MNIYTSADQLIGKTPILQLKNIENTLNLKAHVYAKLEFFNPAGSIKDRVAKKMLDCGIEDGTITPDTVIIEPTSGNTGIGLAAVAAARGLKVIIVMPDTMSIERRQLMTAYGAQLVLSDGSKGMTGAIEKAQEIKESTPGSIIAGQFVNPANPAAHFETTGPEIYEDMDGNIDIFVAGVGTGGTITGTGKYLKSQKNDIEVIAVEPDTSPVLSKGCAGPHKIQGIGAGFVPEILDTSIYDKVLTASVDESYEASRLLAQKEGILVGISSGCVAHAAIELAKLPANEGKNIVVILPDTGTRYLSTPMFETN